MLKNMWKTNQSKIHISLVAIVIFGVASLMMALLFVRTMKMCELSEMLEERGNYDFSFYGVSETCLEALEADNTVEKMGLLHELGEYRVDKSGNKISVGAMEGKATQELVWIPLLKGEYPREEHEICMDRITLKENGYQGELGEEIQLEVDGEIKKYSLCGVIELRQGNSEGTIRCLRKTATEDVSKYRFGTDTGELRDFPMAYLSYKEAYQKLSTKKTHCFVTLKSMDDNNREKFLVKYYFNEKWDSHFCFSSEIELFARLTIQMDLVNKKTFGEYNLSEQKLSSVMESHESAKDIYTEYMIPVLCFLIGFVALISIYNVIRIIVERKKTQFSTLLCLGMKQSVLIKHLLFFYFICYVISLVLGYWIGCEGYEFSLKIWNNLGVSMPSALHVDEAYQYYLPYVKEVTREPWIYPGVVITVAEVLALALGVGPVLGIMPLEIERSKVYKLKKKRGSTLYEILNRNLGRESFINRCIPCFCICSIMVLAVFGYLFFRCKAEYDYSQLEEHIENVGVGNFDYYMDRTEETIEKENCYLEGAHDTGVSQKHFEKLEQCPQVKQIHGLTINRSSALIYPKDDIKCIYLNSQKEQIRSTKELRKWYKELGVKKNQKLFNVPTVGVQENDLQQINEWVKDEDSFIKMEGVLDYKKMASGEEVAVIIKNERQKNAFSLGEELPLCDFVSEGDYKIKRFSPKVSAIIYMNEYEDNFYFEDYLGATINVLTSKEAFSVWQLPDRNDTRVGVLLNDVSGAEEFQGTWYQALAQAKYMTCFDVGELIYVQEKGQRKVMAVFYTLFIYLILLGGITICVIVWVAMQKNQSEMETLSYIGMKKSQLIYMNIRKYVRWILLGGGLSFISVMSFLALCIQCSTMRNVAFYSGTMEQLSKEKPWIYLIPNFDYGNQPVVLATLAAVLGMLAFISIIVLIYLSQFKERK